MDHFLALSPKELGLQVEPMTTRKAMIMLGFPLKQAFEDTHVSGSLAKIQAQEFSESTLFASYHLSILV